VDFDKAVEGGAENAHRKDLLPSELWAVAKRVREVVRRPVGRPREKVAARALKRG
jgi:hypothetical protein